MSQSAPDQSGEATKTPRRFHWLTRELHTFRFVDRVAYVIVGMLAGGLFMIALIQEQKAQPYVVAIVVALTTAGVELLKKYSIGTPIGTLLRCPWTWFYLGLNAVAAAVAYDLIKHSHLFAINPNDPAAGFHWAMTMPLAAGFGAMMVLRSSFITIRTHGHDYPVGPALLLDALQDQIEHRIDQSRASESFREVSDLMQGVAPETCQQIATLAVHVLEKLPDKAQESLAEEIQKLLADVDLSDENKSIGIGISIRKIAGFEVLREVVETVAKKRFVAPQQKPPAPAQNYERLRRFRENLKKGSP